MEERLAALEARVAEQDARRRDRPFAERDLIKAALQWARLTTMGFYAEEGSDGGARHILLNPDDASTKAKWELRKMQSSALDLLRIEASGGDP
jgi:hypothetical protein